MKELKRLEATMVGYARGICLTGAHTGVLRGPSYLPLISGRDSLMGGQTFGCSVKGGKGGSLRLRTTRT